MSMGYLARSNFKIYTSDDEGQWPIRFEAAMSSSQLKWEEGNNATEEIFHRYLKGLGGELNLS